ncbi:replication initiation factor domain-containing protein [Streptococcus panodentis]|uniref:Replication initiation factor domain-containing protein n=1 Tax=Streptococcus panodentis TaxID=1581472 RepID=A0ABS5AUU4_9STRE|nr:replication initiation factor domain-containing protein [Streptococcus panodentis]MBP2620338.1 replication initiation factor domain-containing protein [Streptococcus panodentis]
MKEIETKDMERLRLYLGFSKKEFSKLLTVSPATYNRYLGKDTVPFKKVGLPLQELLALNKETSVRLTGRIDYIRFRFRTLDWLGVIDEVFGLKKKPFIQYDFGRYGYSAFENFNFINVYHSEKDSEMGTLVEMTGRGCREFEWYLENEQNGRTWQEVLEAALAYAKRKSKSPEEAADFLKITRLDVSLDETYNKEEGNYNLYQLKEKKERGLIQSKMRSFKFIDGETQNRADGCSVYFGSRQSAVLLNFYEKDFEQVRQSKVSLDTIRELYGYKNRYEVRMFGDKSHDFLLEWCYQREDMARKAVGVINDKLHVYARKGKRLVLDPDWYKLMGSLKACQFVTAPQEVAIAEKQYRWYERVVAGTRKFLEEVEAVTGSGRLAEIEAYAEIPEKRLKELEWLQDGSKEVAV